MWQKGSKLPNQLGDDDDAKWPSDMTIRKHTHVLLRESRLAGSAHASCEDLGHRFILSYSIHPLFIWPFYARQGLGTIATTAQRHTLLNLDPTTAYFPYLHPSSFIKFSASGFLPVKQLIPPEDPYYYLSSCWMH